MKRDFALPEQPRAVLSYTFFLFAELMDIEVARQDAYQRQADGERILGASSRGIEPMDWIEAGEYLGGKA